VGYGLPSTLDGFVQVQGQRLCAAVNPFVVWQKYPIPNIPRARNTFLAFPFLDFLDGNGRTKYD